MRALLLLFALVLVGACKPAETLTWDGKVFEAHGWKGAMPAGGWNQVFTVHASAEPGAPPMPGTYVRRGETLIFRPASPPPADLRMRAVFHQADGSIASAVFSGLKIASAASVTALYPATAEWPVNLSKIHIQFSAPMMRGAASSQIQLLDEAGAPVKGVFAGEQWSPDGTRLTLALTGAQALVPGDHYDLVIDPSWQAADGGRLAAGMRKAITASPAVRSPIDPGSWMIGPPLTPRSPLVVQFPRPMDHDLALRAIVLEGVEGQARLENDDRRWVFTPKRPWKRGRHVMRIDHVLEDLAGNRPHQALEPDPAAAAPPPAFDRVTFTVE